jgi:hypothetical protein
MLARAGAAIHDADVDVRVKGRGLVVALAAAAACVVSAAACATPAIFKPDGEVNAWHPQPQACAVAGRAALCCPEGFVMGGSRVSSDCADGTCCPFVEGMGKPPPTPLGPVVGSQPGD